MHFLLYLTAIGLLSSTVIAAPVSRTAAVSTTAPTVPTEHAPTSSSPDKPDELFAYMGGGAPDVIDIGEQFRHH
ncbi:hypothetical protein NM688_g1573 [Phlebia brevispora]|uniref:Uncharacterized protein n=1 Tax=Phlebia brevispora TaxID=194682 RepID=A0ACC1TAT0_9APHY|nr:hypothetical protein NM688_g1573 [Phlebia brevispora]